MISLTDYLKLSKPGYEDLDWGIALNANMDLFDSAFGLRTYTEENYIVNDEAHSLSLDKLDVAVKPLEVLMPLPDERLALQGEGTPAAANKFVTKSYVRMARKEVLFPEGAGATLTTIWSAGSNSGVMTSSKETSGNYVYNYFKWLSSLTALNSYDINIQWRVPETFSGFKVTANKALIVDICTEESVVTNHKIDVTVKREGVAGNFSKTGFFSTVAGTWYSEREGNELIGFDVTDLVLKDVVVGDILNIGITVYSKNSKYVKIGAVTVQYTG